MDIVGKYKWGAWTNLGDMTKEDAMKQYVEEIEKLKKEIGMNA
jgi:acyl-CoA-binding protein